MMHKILLPLCLIFLMAACNTPKNYMARPDEDRTLFDAVKALNKRSNDSEAIKAIPVLYPLAQQRHLNKISSYMAMNDLNRWDKVINEFNILQKMYEAISSDATANSLVTANNYRQTISETKTNAAEEFYQEAQAYEALTGRDNSKKAYSWYKKADTWVPGYKDAKLKMEMIYQNAVVNVVIKPVQDNSFFFNSGWGNTGYNYSNEYFQQNLVRDLGGKYANRYPAKFYSEWDAQREAINPDWVVDLTLRNIDIPRPTNYNYSRNASRQVEAGRDTSGKIIYQTVYATVYITRQSFNAWGEMVVEITDLVTRKRISYNNYRNDYSWREEHATYNGDSRALSGSDWQLINNSGFNEPRREDVLNELYRKIYPQVRTGIIHSVDW